jgi:hypothetical protein
MRKILFYWLIYIFIFCLYFNAWTQRKEIVEKRGYYAKTYKHEDGSYSAEISASPVHYRDKDGKFKNIKRQIIPSKNKD